MPKENWVFVEQAYELNMAREIVRRNRSASGLMFKLLTSKSRVYLLTTKYAPAQRTETSPYILNQCDRRPRSEESASSWKVQWFELFLMFHVFIYQCGQVSATLATWARFDLLAVSQPRFQPVRSLSMRRDRLRVDSLIVSVKKKINYVMIRCAGDPGPVIDVNDRCIK